MYLPFKGRGTRGQESTEVTVWLGQRQKRKSARGLWSVTSIDLLPYSTGPRSWSEDTGGHPRSRTFRALRGSPLPQQERRTHAERRRLNHSCAEIQDLPVRWQRHYPNTGELITNRPSLHSYHQQPTHPLLCLGALIWSVTGEKNLNI